jgi:AcrR family transcriptional regulator
MVQRSDTDMNFNEVARPSTKLRIQEAAKRLFAAKGFEGTGIREIADQAGVQTSALYYYMGSKEDLLVDVMVSILEKLMVVAKEALVGATSPPTQLVAIVRAHVGVHALDRLSALVGDGELRALDELHLVPVIKLRDDYEELWAIVLREGLAREVFHFDDAKIVRLALLEMCNGVSRWYSEAGALLVGDVADAFAELALSLVGAMEGRERLRLDHLESPPVGDVLAIIRRVLPSE